MGDSMVASGAEMEWDIDQRLRTFKDKFHLQLQSPNVKSIRSWKNGMMEYWNIGLGKMFLLFNIIS
jgi:hypothetical protein